MIKSQVTKRKTLIIYERTITRVLISNNRNKEQIETIEYLRSNKWKTINQIKS